MIEFLTNLLHSLDRIEVHGQENLDTLLGCMIAIQNVINELKTPVEIPQPQVDDEEGSIIHEEVSKDG